jgi:hypothetical protein
MSGVAYLTEQSPAGFAADAQAAGIGGHPDLHVLCRHHARGTWPGIVEGVSAYVREHALDLVIIDTADVWMLQPGDDPNDSVLAEAAVRCLQPLVEADVAILLLRHERKGGGDIADSGRGSSAFAGAVDALLALRRPPGSGHDNRRELESVARAVLPDVPASVVIELQEDGTYVKVGNRVDVERRDALDRILDYLPSSRETAVTVDELRENTDTAKTLTTDLLRELCEGGAVSREKGAGSASNRAFGYWRPDDGS